MPGDRGEACEAGGLFGVHAAQFRHVDQQHESRDLAQTGDADEDVQTRPECRMRGDEPSALPVYRLDLAPDLLEMLVGLAFQKGKGQALGSVQRRGAILDQCPACPPSFPR